MILFWILLIAWLLFLVVPRIMPIVMRWLGRRMQRRFMRSMGIDPDMFTAGSSQRNENPRGTYRSYKQRRSSTNKRGKIIPDGYGEYVEYEVLVLTGSEKWLDTSGSPIYVTYSETQISEAKYKYVK